jgi:tetratricopeptide (TPR) repeat protein
MAFEWDWKTAQLRRSLTLDPGSVTAWVSWARYLSVRGEHDKAVRAAQHAEALDPHADEAIEEAAWCYYRARRFDQAARQFRLVASRRPEEARAVMIRSGVDESQLRLLQRLEPRQAADAYLRVPSRFCVARPRCTVSPRKARASARGAR